MRSFKTLLAASVAAASFAVPAHAAQPLVVFSGAIGVDPLTAAGGVDAPNAVRGIAPGGRAWVIRKLKATVSRDATISAKGSGLLFSSGDVIGTRGTIAMVAATLACGPANATAELFHSPPAELDLAGDFDIRGVLSQDGVHGATMPANCENPVLLIRAYNAVTGALGGWFAAGIPGKGADD